MITVSTFYKYENLENVSKFRYEHQGFCDNLTIKGKVLVSEEGINGTVSGTEEQIEKYEKELHKYFKDITFKRNKCEAHPFRKTIVRIKNEIVSSGLKVDIKNKGVHLSPKELKESMDKGEDLILLDARNNYESKIGKFKNAITPDIEVFSDFPKVVEQIKHMKDKKIVMYCTGGVRCEKASAYLKENGFENVYQLKDGIINFINQYPDSYFEGRCFVFDDRMSIPSGEKNQDLTICKHCQVPSSQYVNCANVKCNKLFVLCNDCCEKSHSTCSKECRNKISQFN